MPRECPGCGAKTATLEARFCRRCGAPLKTAGGATTDTAVSPVAPTVPLSEEGRATNGLAVEESQRLADHTSRIKRAEMEELLRRVASEHDVDGAASLPATQTAEPPPSDGASSQAAPLAVKDGDSSSSNSSSNALAAPQSPSTSPPSTSRGLRVKRWQIFALVLMCLALFGAALAFISIRRSRASEAAPPTTPPVAEGTQPVVQSPEAAPQVEPLAGATPSPPLPPSAASPLPSPHARETNATQPGAATRETPAVAGASPQPSPTPEAGQPTPPAPPTISPAEHYQRGLQLWATNRHAALEEFRAAVPGVPDAYYYLGSEYYSEGRDVKSLSDGELRAALNYFTRVTSGPHSAQASRHVQALGKEYDRRKKRPRP